MERKYLRLFKKIEKIFSSPDNLHQVAEKVYQEISKSLSIEDFYVVLYDRKDKTISFEIFIENGVEKHMGSGKLSPSLIEYVINSKKPLRVNKDLDKFCKKLGMKSARAGKSAKSWLGVPVIYRNHVEGVICIQDYDEEDVYSEYDEAVVSNIASRMALVIENIRLSAEKKMLSLTDSLTKIANRRYFDMVLNREMKRAVAFSRPLSLAKIEIDNYKNFKDKHGHAAGDKILIYIARFIKNNVRDTDFVARYNDEEFVIVFPETNNSGAMTVSERICSDLAEGRVFIKGLGKKKMTVSIGLATYPFSAETLDELVQSADEALCQAKQLGKNRVETI